MSDEAEQYPEGVYVQISPTARIVGELIRHRGGWYRPNGDNVLAGDIYDAWPGRIVSLEEVES